MSSHIEIERLFGGQPLISPSVHWWESGVTFNAAAIKVETSEDNRGVINTLLCPEAFEENPDGVVVLHYRARPKDDPGRPWTRSFVGMSVHQPDLVPLRRLEHPVVEPSPGEFDYDHLGVEDPRVMFLDGAWWMIYCGVKSCINEDPLKRWLGSICMAKSDDLVNWTKLGPVVGDSDGFARRYGDSVELAKVSNKDGVLFPERIGGKVYMLHRPMGGDMSNWCTCLAVADAPDGEYRDLGPIHGAAGIPEAIQSWVGAGSVPISIGGNRFVSIEHTGSYLAGMKRLYVLDAFLYDFNHLDESDPSKLVSARIDNFMRPETEFEKFGPFPDSVANVVFACGSHLHDGWLYIVYGGGDSYILSARLRFDSLLAALESQSRYPTKENA